MHGGKLFARFWLHNGFVNVHDTKMSKSLGNIVLVRDLLAHAPGEVIRLALLNGHYRQPLDWSEQLLIEMKRKLDRLYGTLRDIEGWQSVWQTTEPDPAFVAALEDDLNTPKALAALFDLSHAANRSESREERVQAAAQLRASADWIGLLSVEPEQWFTAGSDDNLDNAAIDQLLAERNAARAKKDFATADRIRDELAAQGISIEDGAGNTRWRRN